MPREVREKFDPAAEFVATRQFKAGGRSFEPGDKFDTSLVEVRRLLQLTEGRMLRQLPGKARVPRRPVTAPAEPIIRRAPRSSEASA